jgi:MFS family permease
VIAWLLQLNRPLLERSEQELAALVERDYKWNFSVNLVDGVAFWFGLSFISATTILPLFVSKLTASTIPIGLTAIISQAGWYLPQILSANWVERLPRRKPMFVNMGFLLERLPIWVMVVSAMVAGAYPYLALAIFLFSYSWRSFGGGVVGPAWTDLIARVIPVERRGRFWGLTSALGTGAGLIGSALTAWLLLHYPFPTSFVHIFALAAAVISIGWCFATLIREPAQPVRRPRQSQRQYLSSLPNLLRQDPAFGHFLVARVLLGLGALGQGFVTVAAVRTWGVSDGTVGLYTFALLLGQTLGNLAFGLLSDRMGHKLSLELAAVAYFLAHTLAWLAPTPAWYPLVFLLMGLGLGSVLVSGILIVLEFCEPERRPTYAGMGNTAVGIASIAGPLLATALASVGYDLLFATGAAINLAAWVAMRWWVQEPRYAGGSSAEP